MIALWIIPYPVLAQLIELKYENAIKSRPEQKNEDEYLVDFLYLRECLFPDYKTMSWSGNLKNDAILLMVSELRGYKDARYLDDNCLK